MNVLFRSGRDYTYWTRSGKEKGVALAEITLSPRRFARLRRLKVASGRKGPLSLIRWQVY